jgi:hypothetical protein
VIAYYSQNAAMSVGPVTLEENDTFILTQEGEVSPLVCYMYDTNDTLRNVLAVARILRFAIILVETLK